jgi:hypothetical protein
MTVFKLNQELKESYKNEPMRKKLQKYYSW